jgi:hypothetical protein
VFRAFLQFNKPWYDRTSSASGNNFPAASENTQAQVAIIVVMTWYFVISKVLILIAASLLGFLLAGAYQPLSFQLVSESNV